MSSNSEREERKRKAIKTLSNRSETPLWALEDYCGDYGSTVTSLNDSQIEELKLGKVFLIDDGEYTHFILHERFKKEYNIEGRDS